MITIQSELKRRNDLIFSESFRKEAVVLAKKLGITAKEWNENKAVILMHFANTYCSLENEFIEKNKNNKYLKFADSKKNIIFGLKNGISVK